MKRIYLYLFCFCAVITACTQSKSIEKIINFQDRNNIEITLNKSGDISDAQNAKINQALGFITTYINSKEFKETVLRGPSTLKFIEEDEPQTNQCDQHGEASYTYNTVKGRCFNNKEIYEIIKSADWGLNFALKPTKGSTYCNNPWINAVGALEGDTIVTYVCHFDEMSVEFLSGFLIHEYMHAIGFRHPYSATPNRSYTIPYFIGDNAIKKIRTMKNK